MILEGARNDLPDEISLDDLIDTAAAEGVLPLISSRLLSRTRIEARETLEHHLRHAIAVEEMWRAETVRVLASLGEREIESIVLKGTALAYSLYEEPHLRPRVDVDILIPEHDLERVRILMSDLGYQERASWAGDLHQAQTSFQRSVLRGKIVTWDVHWRLSNRYAWSSRFDSNELFEQTRPIPALSSQALGFRAPWSLLHACIHLVGHRPEERRLIWDWDIRLLASALTDAEAKEFTKIVRDHGLQDAVERATAHVRENGFFLPASVLEDGSGGGTTLRPTTRRWKEWRAIPGLKLKSRWLAQLLFPSRNDLQRRYGRTIPAWLYPLYLVRRLIGGIVKNLRKD